LVSLDSKDRIGAKGLLELVINRQAEQILQQSVMA
jgi:hypothetical protein